MFESMRRFAELAWERDVDSSWADETAADSNARTTTIATAARVHKAAAACRGAVTRPYPSAFAGAPLRPDVCLDARSDACPDEPRFPHSRRMSNTSETGVHLGDGADSIQNDLGKER